MLELLCIPGFSMFYLFIYFLQWFAICSYLFGNYISSFRTLFFFQNHELCLCVFNLINKPTPFFQSDSYPEWSSHFSHEIQTVLHDFAFVKKSIMSICMGLTPRKQGPWVLKFSRPTCNGRRWSKAELTGSERLISLSKGAFLKAYLKGYLVVPEISRKSSLSLSLSKEV